METSLEELCRGYPPEFKEFMEYCRALKFEQDPDYKYCVSLFEKCMTRNEYDPKVLDFTWKQNRLAREKAMLKDQLLKALEKKPAEKEKGATSKPT